MKILEFHLIEKNRKPLENEQKKKLKKRQTYSQIELCHFLHKIILLNTKTNFIQVEIINLYQNIYL